MSDKIKVHVAVASMFCSAVFSAAAARGSAATLEVGERLGAALEAAGGRQSHLLISRPIRVTRDLTVPASAALEFRRGGRLLVDRGVTVRLNCSIQAGLWRIFDGRGKVAGRPVRVVLTARVTGADAGSDGFAWGF